MLNIPDVYTSVYCWDRDQYYLHEKGTEEKEGGGCIAWTSMICIATRGLDPQKKENNLHNHTSRTFVETCTISFR